MLRETLKRIEFSYTVIVEDVEIQKSMVTMVPNVPDLVVSQDLASELAKNDMNRLLSSKKLVLIVDLDLTLIHTRMASPDIKLSNLTEEKQIYYTCHMFPGYNVYHQYLTKLRPHVEEFLKVASTLFELHVVTMGSRSYAQDIVGILDPTGSLFYNRILSRDELKSQLLKSTNLNQLFPLGDNLVCIIDDRPEMWAFHPSCIPVPPYSYFANVGDINDPKKLNSKGLKTRDSPDVKENKPVDNNCNTDVNQLEESSPMNQINADSNELNGQNTTECIEKPKITDEKHATSTNDSSGDSRIDTNNNNDDEEIATRQRPSLWKTAVDSDTNIAYYDIKDNYLLNLLPLLQRIHNRFYQQYDQLKEQLDQLPDLKSIIPEIRRNVLKDVKIVFSAIIPSGHPSPEKTYEWILAESLGAKVTHKFHTSPSRKTTHVVTKRVAFQSGYTQKVHLAMKTAGVFVVDIDWLYKCNEFWKKIEEEPYLLAPVCMCSSTRMQLMPKEKRRKSLELQTERFSKRKRTSLDERNETSVGLMMAPDFGLAKELTRRSSSRESSLDSFSISSSSSSCSLSSKSTDSSATESSIDSECEAIGAILEAQLADVN
ncbi:RNA polymerase II subunit A C-terminal domain phosphatase [Trichoplax sp. H2]|nr:RNA polymerase II subunit A C-terminal domain phosphatase [Trichoplax sp. H2]|eukprot:RDD40678.1 RNA polymerase II subunit A C-terminal domain phosphatase [Trichoplax sp. H2]